jgi:hypothetical protein
MPPLMEQPAPLYAYRPLRHVATPQYWIPAAISASCRPGLPPGRLPLLCENPWPEPAQRVIRSVTVSRSAAVQPRLSACRASSQRCSSSLSRGPAWPVAATKRKASPFNRLTSKTPERSRTNMVAVTDPTMSEGRQVVDLMSSSWIGITMGLVVSRTIYT